LFHIRGSAADDELHPRSFLSNTTEERAELLSIVSHRFEFCHQRRDIREVSQPLTSRCDSCLRCSRQRDRNARAHGRVQKVVRLAKQAVGSFREKEDLAVLQCFNANCFYSARNRPTRTQGQFAIFDIVSPKRSQSFGTLSKSKSSSYLAPNADICSGFPHAVVSSRKKSSNPPGEMTSMISHGCRRRSRTCATAREA
jgi:hypothetical protein